ncbi:hypothetical protein V3H18_08985 [Methylocystis sp. 9N]|uniref:DUF748 domain-containing protein n=1 Tax=Methylocystis borbori TaxID=3118750 RepID=A0ABU7XGZ2_9HYPH
MREFLALCVAIFLALAARAAETPLSLDNLVFTLGGTTYRAPRVDIEGASLPRAEMARLFAGSESEIDLRFARLSARRIVIPSLTAESRSETRVARATYRGLVFENVVSGRAAVARGEGGEETAESSNGGVQRVSWGASVSKGVDLRGLMHVALSGRGGADEPLKPLVEEETVESSRFEDSAENFVVATGRLTLAGLRGRALAAPPGKLIERLEKLDPAKPENDAALTRDLLDALLSFEASAAEARDIVATGKGAPAEKPYRINITRLGATKFAGAGVGEMFLEDFSLQASDGGVLSAGRFALGGVELAPVLQGGAYPKFAHVEIKNVIADMPDAKASANSRIKFRLENASADFANFVESTPTKLSARFDKFVVDLAARGETQGTAQFLALGYRDLDLSAFAAGEWRDKSWEAALEPLSIEGADMGAARLSATLNNVSGAVFSSSPMISRAAALAVSVKSVDLMLEGGGLIERTLALEAKERKTTLDQARAEYASAAALAIAELAGGGEKAKRIAGAVSAFILKPKRLHLRLVAPKGVNALDALTKKPGDILEALEVEASAE